MIAPTAEAAAVSGLQAGKDGSLVIPPEPCGDYDGRIELVKLNSQMTLEQFNSRYPSSIPLEQLAIINEVEGPGTSLPAGQTVKRVVGGTRQQG